MIEITLTPEEVYVAEYIGTRRSQTRRGDGTVNQRYDPSQTDLDIDRRGMGAELAVAKYLNLYPDMVIFTGELPQYDLVRGDTKFEIRSTQYPRGKLLITKLDEYTLYILVCGSMPTYTLAGYIEGSRVEEVGEWGVFKYVKCWTVQPEDLEPMDNLITYLEFDT